MHVIWNRSNAQQFQLHVGQAVKLHKRIQNHKGPLYQNCHSSLHYNVWDSVKELESVFVALVARFSSVKHKNMDGLCVPDSDSSRFGYLRASINFGSDIISMLYHLYGKDLLENRCCKCGTWRIKVLLKFASLPRFNDSSVGKKCKECIWWSMKFSWPYSSKILCWKNYCRICCLASDAIQQKQSTTDANFLSARQKITAKIDKQTGLWIGYGKYKFHIFWSLGLGNSVGDTVHVHFHLTKTSYPMWYACNALPSDPPNVVRNQFHIWLKNNYKKVTQANEHIDWHVERLHFWRIKYLYTLLNYIKKGW